MSEQNQPTRSRLGAGTLVSIRCARFGSQREIPASVTQHSENSIELRLSKALDPPLQQGDSIRLKYWDDQAIYFSDVRVTAVSGADNRSIFVSAPSEPVSLQRRVSRRLHSAIPFSFSVLDAANQQLVSGKVEDSQSQDFSAGGLRFETRLPLKEGDELEITLQPSGSGKLRVSAAVVSVDRSEGEGGRVNSVGVEFLALGTEERGRLVEFMIETRAKEEEEGTAS